MAEVLPSSRVDRWYQVRRSGTDQAQDPVLLFAERYFDREAEAFDYWERRMCEVGPDRVHRPVRSHEDPHVWAVCIDPQ